ncbi:MAG: PD-(D/E)XK nuclease family protein [Treponema sp.]|jgi:hypothetical protein|nr:PD-(D/E)XK nuclease family protein [Treponema sp.]
MAPVFETILEHISDHHCRFVFPSETAALTWARKVCLYGMVRSVTPDRFLAWDRFKEETINAPEKGRRPVSSLVRRLFARSLIQKNAAAPFLSAIVPVEFAETGEVFAPSIAASLSSLAFWAERRRSLAAEDDAEDRDLVLIKNEYAAFLNSHGLFEPSWEQKSFCDTGNSYIIFFPEVLEDFTEYRNLLGSRGIVFYSADNYARTDNSSPAEKQELRFFESAGAEIRSAVSELRRLHEEEGLPYEEMALSLPGFDAIEPYVSRELALQDIPFTCRAGKSLGTYPAGRLFSLIGECAASLFSFDALKPLLLNGSIPWKDSRINRELIRFGIENHCVSPFNDRGRTLDPWEEGFKRKPREDLAACYRELKQRLSALASAKTFREIQEKYFAFRTLLDMEQCGPESNAVLARCVEELASLIDAEEEFPDLFDGSGGAFNFYVSCLMDKNYVYAQQEAGVNIYDYPVAAGAPFGCHMVLNVSQEAATVQHRPLSFLRQDKRAVLGIEDHNVSGQLLALYSIAPWKDYVCRTWISASEKTFTGWAIPHSAFATKLKREGELPETGEGNPFTAERRWWAGSQYGKKPQRLFSVQRRGFENWSRILLAAAGSTGGGSGTAALLREWIQNKNAGSKSSAADPSPLSVSATDLNEFFACPRFWLYRRIFRLKPFREDAALLDDESKGLIYHEILRRLFGSIKERDTRFLAQHLENYCTWAEEFTNEVLRSDDTLRGPLVYPLLLPLAAAMNQRLRALLKTEARYFSGFEIEALEQTYGLSEKGLRLTGRIDRVSLAEDGAMIIDYKTGTPPSRPKSRTQKTESSGSSEAPGLEDFQIPMYIKLYEAAEGKRVSRAFFIGINKQEIIPVVGDLEGRRSICSREDYEPAMDALERGIDLFGRAVSALDFTPQIIPFRVCVSCDYKTICRFLYSLNSFNPRNGTARHEDLREEQKKTTPMEEEKDNVF